MSVARALWLCLAVQLPGLAVPAAAQTFSGRVVAVPDGQTLRLRDDHGMPRSVRLRGIAAPVPGQPFWSRSRQSLAEQVFAQQVQVEPQTSGVQGEVSARVLRGPVDINLTQLQRGMAWYDQPRDDPGFAQRDIYLQAQHQARAQRRGLWRRAEPVPPWSWAAQPR